MRSTCWPLLVYFSVLSYLVRILNICWVRVASSTWNVLRLWNTNKERPQNQVQEVTGKFVDNLIEQQRQRRSIRMSMLKVVSPNGVNSRRTKLEQCNNQWHLYHKDVVLCIYLNYCIFIFHMYRKSHLGGEQPITL